MTKKRTVGVKEKESKKEKEVSIIRKVSLAVQWVLISINISTVQAPVPLKRSGRLKCNIKTDTVRKGKFLKVSSSQSS